VSEGALGGKDKFIAEPLVENVVEEDHAGIHVEASLIVENLVPQDVGHSCSLWISGDVFHIVDSLQ